MLVIIFSGAIGAHNIHSFPIYFLSPSVGFCEFFFFPPSVSEESTCIKLWVSNKLSRNIYSLYINEV